MGNTGSGVFKNDVYNVYIDISGISDLLSVCQFLYLVNIAKVTLNNGATFGSAVTIQNMLYYLDQWSNSTQFPVKIVFLMYNKKKEISNSEFRCHVFSY